MFRQLPVPCPTRTFPQKPTTRPLANGRFAKILPAVVLYILYLVGLNAARGGVEAGDISPFFGLWWVHLVFLIIGLALMAWTFGWKVSSWPASLGLARRRELPLIVKGLSVDEGPQAGADGGEES